MFQFEANEAIIIEQKRALEAALSTNPKTEAVLRKIIRKEILAARKKVVDGIRFKSDPRKTRLAVRTTVYRKILGANINIYDSRKRHGWNDYEPPRKLRPGQRGGNRVPRGRRTDDIMHYSPLDRGFILRFVNSGTQQRIAGTRGGALSGKRGNIVGRNFFRGASERQLVQAADNISNIIEKELASILDGRK